MKKVLIIILNLCQVFCHVEAQSCLPAGVTFGQQWDIDEFQADNPGCTAIEGDVTIVGPNITSLAGLSVLTAINGDLHLWNLDGLYTFSGLDNVSDIGGSLKIDYNDSILNLEGLNSLSSVGGDVVISLNDSLINFSGLNSLDSIGGLLKIHANYNLEDLSGLDNLKKINGRLILTSNLDLKNIQNLQNLAHLGGDLYLVGNDELVSLVGLDKLTTVNGLNIGGNNELTDLAGLGNLVTVNGDMEINGNTGLLHLTGLEELKSVSGYLYIFSNWSLVDMTSLENLTSITGTIFINENFDLLSLNGIGNIAAEGIEDLYISSNNDLTDCAVLSICDYLAAPNGDINIYDNATGCNNQQEVEESCGVGLEESNDFKSTFLIYPSPADSYLHIESNKLYPKGKITIYNMTGQPVMHTDYARIIDISKLGNGLYFMHINSEGTWHWHKILIVKQP